MIGCPGEEGLLDFLKGQLDSPSLAAATEHVETCATCQDRLEVLTHRPSLVFRDTATENGSSLPAVEAAGTVLAGRYRLREVIGVGGMGTVWSADQTAPVRRTVAVKVIKGGMGGAEVLRRFEAERQALALMDHPNIARVFDGGETADGRPFFVMELVAGQPITGYCDEVRMDLRGRLELFGAVCRAVQHAHQKGIVHRDLKPSNVLVATVDGQPVPKVIDFGIAKAVGDKRTDATHATQAGTVVGTLDYMSPEQAAGAGDIDTRSDVYSLGVILYEQLAGRLPLDARRVGLGEALRAIQEEEPPRPSVVAAPASASALRGDLDWVAMKCLEKPRDRRYESADALARDIERFLADEPVEARPPSAGYRLGKFLRRHKLPVAAGGLVLAALVAAVGVTSWGLVKADRARVRAEAGEDLASRRLVQVEAEKARADEEAQIAKAVRDFLQVKLLGQADALIQSDELRRATGSSAGAKPNPTLRELLDRAAAELTPETIDANFPRQPALQAELLATLGNAYGGVAEYETAAGYMRRAVALRTQHLGADHPSTLAAVQGLAQAYNLGGKRPLAVETYEQACAAFARTLGPDHPDTQTARTRLASVYRVAGNLARAIEILEQVRAAQLKRSGPDDLDYLWTCHTLAATYRDAGKLAAAVELFEQVRDARTARLGPDHPHTLNTLNSLAATYQDVGKLPEAVALYERVRATRAKIYGDDHPETLSVVNNLGVAVDAAGDSRRALDLFETTHALRAKKLGPDHPDTLATLHNLADVSRRLGDLSRATDLYERVRDAQVRVLGADHPSTLTTLSNLGLAYVAGGKHAAAIELLGQVRDTRTCTLGADHPSTLITLGSLAHAYQRAGKPAEALALKETVVASLEARGFIDGNARTPVMNLVGDYEATRRYDDEEALLRKWVAAVRTNSGAGSQAFAAESANLGFFFVRRQRWTDAEPPLRESLAVDEAVVANNWQTSHTKALLGAALLGQKKFAEAEPVLLAAYAGMKKEEATLSANGRKRLADAAARLVELYDATDRPDDAAKWRKERERIGKP